MKPNNGTRPLGLKNSDKIRVKLRNGMVREWPLTSRYHPFPWAIQGDDFDIMEWERVK